MKKILELVTQIDPYIKKYFDRIIGYFNNLVDDITFSPWTDLTLNNYWEPYGGVTVEYAQPQYCYNKQGIVKLRGMIKNGTTTNGTTVATIPVELAPSGVMRFVASCQASATVCSLNVDTLGRIRVYGAASSTFISLDTIMYVRGN